MTITPAMSAAIRIAAHYGMRQQDTRRAPRVPLTIFHSSVVSGFRAGPTRSWSSVPEVLVDDIDQRLSALEPAQVFRKQRHERRPVILHGAGGVRRDDHVRQIPVWALAVQWLGR